MQKCNRCKQTQAAIALARTSLFESKLLPKIELRQKANHTHVSDLVTHKP